MLKLVISALLVFVVSATYAFGENPCIVITDRLYGTCMKTIEGNYECMNSVWDLNCTPS